MSPERQFVAVAGLSALIAVAAGAFGAHALRDRLTAEMLTVFETGARYQMYHALALLFVAWAASRWQAPQIGWAGLAVRRRHRALLGQPLHARAHRSAVVGCRHTVWWGGVPRRMGRVGVGSAVASMKRPAFAPAERRVIRRHRTPRAVQRWLRALPYNWERGGRHAALVSWRGVLQHRALPRGGARGGDDHGAARLSAAGPRSGVARPARSRGVRVPVPAAVGCRGRIARHGAVWAASRVSDTAGPGVELLLSRTSTCTRASWVMRWSTSGNLGGYDWRTAEWNMWKVERFLIEHPHRAIRTSDARYRKLRAAYRAYIEHHPPTGTPHTRGRRYWM